jgi:hypothetical protein
VAIQRLGPEAWLELALGRKDRALERMRERRGEKTRPRERGDGG